MNDLIVLGIVIVVLVLLWVGFIKWLVRDS